MQLIDTTMLRAITGKLANTMRAIVDVIATPASHDDGKSYEEFSGRYVEYLNRCDCDGWMLRKAMNDLAGMDLVPDPDIIEAALRACRRNNDIALAIRWLECCYEKCGDRRDEIYPYILTHIRPTLNELSIPTPQELNYDKPQLALKSVFDM